MKQNLRTYLLGPVPAAAVAALVFIIPFLSHASNLTLSASIDKTDIPYEGEVTLSVEINWRGTLEDYSFGLMPLPETDKFKVAGTSSSISTEEDSLGQDITIRQFKYTLKPVEFGIATIYPITLDYTAFPDSIPGQLTTQQFKVNIDRPIPKEEKSQSNTGLYLLIILGAAIVIAVPSVYFIFIRKKEIPEPELSPEKRFIEDFRDVKKESINDRRQFFARLHKTIVSYFSQKYDINPTGKTAAVIIEELKEREIPETELARPADWLTIAETEKYAPTKGEPGDLLRLAAEIEAHFEDEKDNTSNKPEAK